MAALFADLPEALENSVEIARRCAFEFSLGKTRLPDFPTPEGVAVGDYLRMLAMDGPRERTWPSRTRTPRSARPSGPATSSASTTRWAPSRRWGFPGYFLIVADFINWAKRNGVPVGPGRGSGAGSLVAWSLGITGLDPLRYELLFERFLNPERVSMPDFDIDFCQEGRDRVIEYVRAKYGAAERLADRHLRHHGGQGRGARRGARPGHGLRRGRPHREADPLRARHHARRRRSRRSRS